MSRALLLAVVAVLAGCGQSGASSDPVETTDVLMAKSYKFDPEVIAVDAGSRVTWRNDDNFTHTVEVEGHDNIKVEPGDSAEVVFAKPGTYEYVCTLHSHDMKGKVIVR